MTSIFVGREAELGRLDEILSSAVKSVGYTVVLSGEPGIGKTRLVEEAKARANSMGFNIIEGACSAEGSQPFQPFSRALGASLFQEEEYVSFAQVIVIDESGRLVAKTSRNGAGGLDTDAFAGMLSAVQHFLGDAFASERGALGKLEYGDMDVLIERAGAFSLIGITGCRENAEMQTSLRRLAGRLSGERALLPEGRAPEAASPLQAAIDALASARFLAQRNFEGVRLESERTRIANDILEELNDRARSTPVLLVLEDLHWADDGSLFALRYIARNLEGLNALLLCTLRPSEGPTAQKAVDTMKDEGVATELKLEGLDVPGTTMLIESQCPCNEFPAGFAERLHRDCAGNPLFITELLRFMEDEGAIVRKDGGCNLVREDFSTPSSVDNIVRRRLDSLDPDTMAMAEYASCIGRDFPLSVAFSISTLRNASRAIEKLRDAGIIDFSGDSAQFSHALFHAEIYNALSAKWKAAHHKNLGEHYEHAIDIDDVVYELARHFSRTAEHAKSFEYCRKAGAKAEAAFAIEMAVEYYETCLSVAPKLRPEHALAEGAVCDILERQGDLYTFMGDFTKGLEKFDECLAAAAEKEVRARLLRKAGELHGRKGDIEKCFKVLEQACKVLEESKGPEYGRICMAGAMLRMRRSEYGIAAGLLEEAVRVFEGAPGAQYDMGNALRLTGNLHLFKAEFDSAREYYERSIVLSKACGNDIGVSSNYNNLGIVYKEKRDFSKSLEYYRKSLDILNSKKDQFAMGNLLHNMGNVYRDMGDSEEALRLLQECIALRRKLGDKFGMESTLAAMSGIYYMQGELGRALALLTDAHDLGKKIGDVHGQAMAIANLGLVYKSMGELDKALDCYRASNEMREKINDKIGMGLNYYNAGNVYLLKGEIESSLDNFNKSLQLHKEAGDKDGLVYAYYGLAEAKARLGNADEALENALTGMEISVQAKIKPLEGMGHRILGIVRTDAGDFEEGCQSFEKALHILREVGDSKQIAELLYEYARLNRKMGDGKKADAQLREALAEFERMGMGLWAEKARKALENL